MSLSRPMTRGLRSNGQYLIGILVIFLVVDMRWIWLFRHGQPLDIDEAGYIGISMIDYYGFLHHGLQGFLTAVWGPSIQAPLTTALAGLFFCITGPHVIVSFAVPMFSALATIFAGYCLGYSLGGLRIALFSSALVASCPIIIIYSRSFMFALPATAVATIALVALLESDRFRSLVWASIFGVSFGLMPLARTMTIAFVPGIALGAILYTIPGNRDRRKRFLTLAISLLLAVAVAASWLWPNGRYVFHYLLSFGYGDHAAEYGQSHSVFAFATWLLMARVLVSYVHLPHAVLLLIGSLAMLVLAGRHLHDIGVRQFFVKAISSKILPVVVFVAEAATALASSQNNGDAFVAPLVPAAIVLAVWACDQIGFNKIYRLLFVALAAGTIVLSVLPTIDLNASIADPVSIDVPLLGPSTLTDGRAEIQVYEQNGGFTSDDPAQPISDVTGKAWVNFSAITAANISELGGGTPTAFGFRHYLYNVNTVGLEDLVERKSQGSFILVDPVETGDTVAGDVAWLTVGSAAPACLLITSDDEARQFAPLVSNSRMMTAASQAGFKSISRWTMPDEHQVTVWVRQTVNAGCSTTTPLTPEPNAVSIPTGSSACSIDAIDGKPPSKLSIAQNYIRVEGWAAISLQKGIAPKTTFVTITGADGSVVTSPARIVSRPDVNIGAKMPKMGPVGYTALVDLAALPKGVYSLGVQVEQDRHEWVCPLKIPFTFLGAESRTE